MTGENVDVQIAVGSFTGTERVALHLVLEGGEVEILLEKHEALDLAEKLRDAADGES